MPFCKNNDKRTYKGNEPSPKGLGYCAHTEEVDKIMDGLDGNKWIISVTSRGVKRWVKYTSNEKSINKHKNNCSKFVIYEKKYETGFFIKSIKYDLIKGIEDKKKRLLRKFITYNTFENNYTEVPDDYKKKKLSKKTINDYYCGSKIILEKNNEDYKKINKKHSGYKSYFTHWNGGNPFCVYIKNDEVYIYYIPENVYIDDSLYSNNQEDNKWMYIKLFEKFTAEKIFIGESPKSYTNQQYDGNTLLLKMKNNSYIYINLCIQKIKYNTEIIDYISPIAGSDIPCPYALDKNNNIIMINQEVILEGMKNVNDPNLYLQEYLKKHSISEFKKLNIKTIKCCPNY